MSTLWHGSRNMRKGRLYPGSDWGILNRDEIRISGTQEI